MDTRSTQHPSVKRLLFLSGLALAWFWFMIAALTGLIYLFTCPASAGKIQIRLFLYALGGGGLLLGVALNRRLAVRRTEPGLIPIGSIGMSLFALDMCFALRTVSGLFSRADFGSLSSLLSTGAGWRLSADILFFTVSAGLFALPLQAFIRNQKHIRTGRCFLPDNFRRALIFAGAALALIATLSRLGLPVWWHCIVLAVLNLMVAYGIYRVIPEFFFRFLCFVLSRIIYRVTVDGLSRLPEKGPAVLVCNHITFVDWLIIAGACPRPVRFVMDQAFLDIPFTGRLFRDGKVIPISPGRKSPRLLKAAFERIALELASGNIVCIFPEGEITRTGRINPFKPGIERIISTTPVPVIPMALNGLWGSFFSRKYGRAMSRPFRRFRSRITLTIGSPVAPETVTAAGLHAAVAALFTGR